MSVAEALRQQRVAIPVNPKLPPSILHTSRAASRIPLSEQASLTLNSLSLLSTVDDRLPSFATNLLLENPVSRQTLDPTTQKAVSFAVISISRHLAPIFPVRHAQRVFEWLVNGLHTGLLGTDAEIDALLLSALPFYSIAQFPTFVSAVVKPRPHRKWEWLKSVVDTSKPASTSYLVQYCPISVHRMTIEWGVQLVLNSIPCTFTSSFLANVTARWISTTATTNDRRSIVSDALIAISSVVSLNQKDVSHFVCALFTVISSAVVSGVSEDTYTAIASATAVVAGRFTDEIAETAFAMLALLINRYGPSCLLASCARNLIGKRKAGSLSKLGDISQKLYSQIVLCALENSIPMLSTLNALKEALFGDGSKLIPSETVTEIVAKLLDLISLPETNGAKLDRSKDIYDPLVSILTPLARGRFSNAVDLGLRRHFDGRTTAKTDGKTKNVNDYTFADEVLSASLHGTSFQIIKSKSGDETMDADGMMMLSALDHPELSVRKNALERIADAYAPSNEDQPILREDLQSKVLSIIKHDSIPSVVLSACGCVFKCPSLFKSDILFNEIGSQLLAFLGSTASESKNSGEVQQLTEKYMAYLSDLPLKSQTMDVLAFIIGASTNKLLGDNSQVLDQAVSVLRKCCTHVKIALPPFAGKVTADSCAQFVSNAVGKLAVSLNFRHDDLLQSLVKWNPSWTFGVIKRWAETFPRQPNRSTVNQLVTISTHALSQAQLHDIAFKAQFNQAVVALSEAYLKQTEVPNKMGNASLLWKLSASKITGASCGKVLRSLVIAFRKSGTLTLLKRTYEESKETPVQVISFKWYMYLASTHQTPNLTLIDLIRICYGDNVELREQGKLFCKNYLKLPQASNEVTSFCRALFRNSNHSFDEGESIDVSKKLNMWLNKLVIKPQVERLNTLSPLPHGGGISKTMANNIHEAITGAKSSKDMLPLLRVLFECEVDIKQQDGQLSLWSPLHICLETLLQNRDSASLESVARLIMLLSAKEKCYLSLQNIGPILKSIQHVFESKAGEESTNEALRITLLAGGILLSQPEKVSKQPKPIVNASFFKLLLSLSSKSSTVGIFVREVLDEYKETLIPFSFLVEALSEADPFLKNDVKRRKIQDESGEDPSTVKPVSFPNLCVGTLETIRRLVSSEYAATYLSELDDDIVNNLNKIVWKFINSICSLINEKSSAVDESMEYILLLSLDILSALVKCNHLEKTLYRTDSSLKLLSSLLSYSGWDSEREEETASVTAIKKSILDFVVVLAPVSNEQVKEVSSSVISALLKSKDLGRISSYFDILIPCLLKSKMKFKSIAQELCTAAFASSNPSNRSDLRTIVASTCRFAPHVEAAVTDSISHIFEIEKDRMNIDQLGRECSLFLLAASLNVTQDIIVISKSTEDVRFQLVSFVLMDSSFMTKLFETMTSINDEQKSEVMKVYSEMLVSLANCKTVAMKESAMGTAFGILPLSGLGTCFVRAMHCDVKTRTVVMNAFASRLNDYDSPLVMDWNEEHIVDMENDESAEKLFLGGCSTRISDEMKSNDLTPIHLIRAAFDCSEGLLKRFGAADTTLSMRLANDVLEKLDECMIHVRGISNDTEEYCDSVSAALRCQSTVVTEFGTQAVGIIPRLLDAAVTLIELAFNGKHGKSTQAHENVHLSVYSMTDSAVRVCLSIIESAPKFFGEKSLKRLTNMLVKKHSKVLEDILRVGMRQLPGVSVVSAVASTCEQLYEHDASASGIGAIMDCLRDGLSSLKKSEVKLEGKKLLDVALRCLEFGRGDGKTPNRNIMLFPPSERLKNISAKDDPVLSVLKFVDDKCGNLLTTLTLRLPESEFKVLFDRMAHWCDAGTIPDQLNADCKKVGVSLHNNLLRAVPFYRLSLRLFDNLEVIMVPYYMQQLSEVLSIIELPNVRKEFLKQRRSLAVQSGEQLKNRKGKKRKRAHIEEDQAQATCDHFTKLQVNLQDLCLDGVTKMLNQGSNSTRFLGVEIVSKIQDSLLKCFDERDGQCERVSKALCALCVRISEMRRGDGSREESRELLNSVSRQLLLRTREDIVALREGSLIASRAIAVAVGDEYLVTLPETMPVLAEVIDDEDIAVQKAAKAFGIVMETMAGEPLLSQLK